MGRDTKPLGFNRYIQDFGRSRNENLIETSCPLLQEALNLCRRRPQTHTLPDVLSRILQSAIMRRRSRDRHSMHERSLLSFFMLRFLYVMFLLVSTKTRFTAIG